MPNLTLSRIKEPFSIVTSLSAPSSKTPKESYQSTGISLKSGKLEFRCDGQAGFGVVQIDVDSDEEFEKVFVNTQKLNSAIGVIGQEFNISPSSGGITISNSKTSIELRSVNCLDCGDFMAGVNEWTPVDGKTIADAVSRTYGLFDSAVAVVLDSRGVVACFTPTSTAGVWTTGLQIPVSCKIAKESCRILESVLKAGACEFGKIDNLCVVRFSSSGFTGAMAFRVFDDTSNLAKFLYKITEKPRRKIASVLKADLLQALKACSVVQTVENMTVNLKAERDQLHFTKRATDYGTGMSVVSLQNKNPDLSISEPHCAERLLKIVSSAMNSPSIDIYDLQLVSSWDDQTNLMFVDGNTCAVSMVMDE